MPGRAKMVHGEGEKISMRAAAPLLPTPMICSTDTFNLCISCKLWCIKWLKSVFCNV